MAQPRAYLFYGTDSWASSQALRRWRTAFEEKYGISGSFCLDADESSPARFAEELASFLQGRTLFDEARLLVIRRVTSQEKGKGASFSHIVVKALQANLAQPDAGLTVAVWEENGLPASRPLFAAFAGWAAEGTGALRRYDVPTPQNLPKTVRTYLAQYGQDIEPNALRWLGEQYRRLERSERLVRRLKTGEELLEDEHSWWLRQVVEGASLRGGPMVGREDFEAGHRQVGEPVGAFDIAQAISNGRWGEARQLAAAFEEQQGGASSYFGLLAAIGWQVRRSAARSTTPQVALMSRLLGEMELIIKNSAVQPAWLLDLFIGRMGAADAHTSSLISPRRLWLSQLPRS